MLPLLPLNDSNKGDDELHYRGVMRVQFMENMTYKVYFYPLIHKDRDDEKPLSPKEVKELFATKTQWKDRVEKALRQASEAVQSTVTGLKISEFCTTPLVLHSEPVSMNGKSKDDIMSLLDSVLMENEEDAIADWGGIEVPDDHPVQEVAFQV